VAAVAMQHDIPMVVLPGGTRCHFARDLGMDPKRIVDALESFNGVERRVDVGDINGRIFLNNASFGLYGEIIDHPDYREHKVDATRAVLRRIMEQHSLYDLQFVDTHGNFYQQVVSLLVGVNKYEMVHLLELGYRKQLDGGVLQASAITELNDQWMRRLLAQTPMSLAKFSKGMEGFAQWETGTLRVNSSSEMLVVGVDGEREEYVAPVDISIKPGALRLLVPAEGDRPRRMRAFDTEVVRALRQEATGKS